MLSLQGSDVSSGCGVRRSARLALKRAARCLAASAQSEEAPVRKQRAAKGCSQAVEIALSADHHPSSAPAVSPSPAFSPASRALDEPLSLPTFEEFVAGLAPQPALGVSLESPVDVLLSGLISEPEPEPEPEPECCSEQEQEPEPESESESESEPDAELDVDSDVVAEAPRLASELQGTPALVADKDKDKDADADADEVAAMGIVATVTRRVVICDLATKDMASFRLKRTKARMYFLDLINMAVWREPDAPPRFYILDWIRKYLEHVKMAILNRKHSVKLWLTSQPEFVVKRALTPEFCQRMTRICEWWQGVNGKRIAAQEEAREALGTAAAAAE